MAKIDELRTIISFIQAAQLGSFTQAAEVLGLTPAAVSKNVSTLEKSLGIRLFNRTTRSLSLTPEGEQFANQAKYAVDLLNQAKDRLHQSQQDINGMVKLSLPNTIGRLFVAPLLAELHACYPQLQLELDFENRIIDFVKDGFDLVLRGGVIEDSALISRKVGAMKLYLVASADYLNRHGSPQNPKELLNHQLLSLRFHNGQRAPWRFKSDDGNQYSLDLQQARFTMTENDALLTATLAGVGIAQLPYYIIEPYLRTKQLQQIHLAEHQTGQYELALQYPHRAYIAPRVKAVVDFLVEKLQNEPRLNPK